MTQAGNVFSKIALEANRLTQLEATFSPNYNGETLIDNPRMLIQTKRYKQDIGFVVLEVTTDEATTISIDFFGNDNIRDIIFGADKSQLWPGSNDHVLFPLAAYEKFLSGIIPQAVVPQVLQAFPCAPNMDFGAAAPLMTECVDAVAEFVNAYTFTCPIELAAAKGLYGQSNTSYNVMFGHAKPGPGPHNTDGKKYLLPYKPSFDKCYAEIENRSCHMSGAKWFFGEYLNQEIEVTDAESKAGKLYRQTYGDLIRSGSSQKLASAMMGAWNKFTVDNGHELVGPLMAAQCQIMNSMEQTSGFYGKFR